MQHIDRHETNNKLADVFEVVKSLRVCAMSLSARPSCLTVWVKDEKAELMLTLETMMKTNQIDENRYKTGRLNLRVRGPSLCCCAP